MQGRNFQTTICPEAEGSRFPFQEIAFAIAICWSGADCSFKTAAEHLISADLAAQANEFFEMLKDFTSKAR
ncbi:MAG: hypothetical protein ACLPID_13095 [Beijerinckiaceae bacterium]